MPVADTTKMLRKNKKDESKLVKEDLGLTDEIIELLKNLTSMESHAQASYKSTGDERFLKAKEEYRKIRTKWLSTITKKNFGQIWCLNKHSFEVMMRLDEIQARFLSTGQIQESKQCSEDYNVILFWLLELNDIGGKNVSKTKSSA